MKTSKITIDTKEALNRLAHPTFFDEIERRSAFDIVMRDGSPTQKDSAEQALKIWPLETAKGKVTV